MQSSPRQKKKNLGIKVDLTYHIAGNKVRGHGQRGHQHGGSPQTKQNDRTIHLLGIVVIQKVNPGTSPDTKHQAQGICGLKSQEKTTL